jgi:putative copper export protein
VTYYEVLLFVHVLGVAIWLGTGIALLVIGDRFGRAGDNKALQSLFGQSEWLATRIFIPVSLLVVIVGILLVIEGPWAFDQLWYSSDSRVSS